MGPPTCSIANADDIRETSISVFQSAILPADGMMAAGRPRRRLRHAPFGSSPHHTRLPLDVKVADLGEKFTSRIFAELHCTELSRRTVEVGHLQPRPSRAIVTASPPIAAASAHRRGDRSGPIASFRIAENSEAFHCLRRTIRKHFVAENGRHPPHQKQTCGSAMMSATLFSAPSLSTFANQKPNDTEGSHRVHPPCAYGKLHNQRCDHDKR